MSATDPQADDAATESSLLFHLRELRSRLIRIVAVTVLLLFGTKRLRNLGGDLGNALKGFRDAMKDDKGGDKVEEQPSARVIEGEAKEKSPERQP